MGCYCVSCVNEPFVHGLTRREADQVEWWWRHLTNLTQARFCPLRETMSIHLLSDQEHSFEGTFLYLLVALPRIAHSSSRNAVSFSSARTMKRFPLSACASAIQTGRRSRPDRPDRLTTFSAFSTDIGQTRELLSRTCRELRRQVRARTAAQCTYWKFGECVLIR